MKLVVTVTSTYAPARLCASDEIRKRDSLAVFYVGKVSIISDFPRYMHEII